MKSPPSHIDPQIGNTKVPPTICGWVSFIHTRKNESLHWKRMIFSMKTLLFNSIVIWHYHIRQTNGYRYFLFASIPHHSFYLYFLKISNTNWRLVDFGMECKESEWLFTLSACAAIIQHNFQECLYPLTTIFGARYGMQYKARGIFCRGAVYRNTWASKIPLATQ